MAITKSTTMKDIIIVPILTKYGGTSPMKRRVFSDRSSMISSTFALLILSLCSISIS